MDTSGWVEVTDTENENEIILGYGEAGAMEPVAIGDEVAFSGRLHCLADAVTYSRLSNTDMDINVEACLVYGTSEDVGYNTGAGSLWQAYSENKQ